MAKNYYKKIKGENYDRALLELTENLLKGQGDGRISIKDSKKIFQKIKDGNVYTDVEKKTVKYILDNFKFTEEAKKWLKSELKIFSSKIKSKTNIKKLSKEKPVKLTSKPKKKQKKAEKKIEKDVIKQKTKISKKSRKPDREKSIAKPIIQEKPADFEKTYESQKFTPVEKKEMGMKKRKRMWSFLFAIPVIALIAYFLLPGLRNQFVSNKLPEKTKDTLSESSKEQNSEQTNTDIGKNNISKENIAEESTYESNLGKIITMKDGSRYYIIKAGDELRSISKEIYGSFDYTKKLYETNANIIKDSNLIFPGQKIRLPENGKK